MKKTTRERASANLLLQNTIRVPSSSFHPFFPTRGITTEQRVRIVASANRRERSMVRMIHTESYLGTENGVTCLPHHFQHCSRPLRMPLVFPPFCKASLYLTEQSNTQSIPQSKSQPEEANNSEQQMMPKNGTISRSPKGNKRGRSMITFSDIGKCQCCGVPSYCQECPHCHLKVRCLCFFCSL